jgi:hypothetical protein
VKVTRKAAIEARRPLKIVSEAEDAETLKQAQMLEAQRLAEANPIRAECQKLGEELKAMGVPWHFGDTVNTDFHTAVIAEASFQLLTEDLGVPLERAQDVIFMILRNKMQQTITAAKAQKSQIVRLDAPEVPPDLLPFNGKKPSD